MQKAHEMVRAALVREEAAVKAATELVKVRVEAAVQNERLDQISIQSQIIINYENQRSKHIQETQKMAEDIANLINSYVDWYPRRRTHLQQEAEARKAGKHIRSSCGMDSWTPEDQAKNIKASMDPIIEKLKGLR
jgi:hypothetical protein